MVWNRGRFLADCKKYGEVGYIYDDTLGCISWRLTTGGNLEMLELEAKIPGLGQGYLLYRQMVQMLLRDGKEPEHSVIGYRRTENTQAEYFYRKMGWKQIDLGPTLYAKGVGTTLMWTTWKQLVERMHLK